MKREHLSLKAIMTRWSAQRCRLKLIHRLYELRMEITRETLSLYLAVHRLRALEARIMARSMREGRVA